MNEMKSLTLGGKTYNSFVDAAARKSISAMAADYYSTTREEPEGVTSAFDITTEYIYGLYDALMGAHPDKVTMTELYNSNDADNIVIREYVISTVGNYAKSTDNGGYNNNPELCGKAPKYLLTSSAHGNESITALYLYRFIRDVLDGRNMPNSFKDGAEFRVLPVMNPWGLDHYGDRDENGEFVVDASGSACGRRNKNGVDIERNFAWKWDESTNSSKGSAAESEAETQTVANWLRTNTDAELWIDVHNSADAQEKVMVAGCPHKMVDKAKKIAMRGLSRVIPFWRDVIGYPVSVETSKIDDDGNAIVKDVIFAYTATLQGYGKSYGYAPNVLGINAIVLELIAYYGTYAEWKDEKAIHAEAVAMGAEAIGNTLIEFYNEEFNRDTGIEEKLNDILELAKKEFHIETGVYHAVTSNTATQKYTVDCSPGAKIFVLTPDEETYNRLVVPTMTGPIFLGIIGQMLEPLPFMEQFDSGGNATPNLRYNGYVSLVKNRAASDTKQVPNYHYALCDNTDGFSFTVNGMMEGYYNWTAYYWND